MAGTYEVIKYVKLNFSSNWTQQLLSDRVMQYAAGRECSLLVVSEGSSGLWSYKYQFKGKEVVYVIGDLVHIPAHHVEPANNANLF